MKKIKCVNISFSTHTSLVAGKGDAKLGFVRRNILSESIAVNQRAYKQLMRPILEYSMTSWNQITKTQQAVQMVNRIRSTDRTTSVTALVSSKNWAQLSGGKNRRLTVFKRFHFITDKVRSYLNPNPPIRSSSHHGLQYQIPHSRTKWHQCTYLISTIKHWNNLPSDSSFESYMVQPVGAV